MTRDEEKRLVDNRAQDELEWRELYKEALDGPYTVECECGSGILGDGPAILIRCFLCFRKEKHGVK